jgi:hypothetical protein
MDLEAKEGKIKNKHQKLGKGKESSPMQFSEGTYTAPLTLLFWTATLRTERTFLLF